jgi:hypothetical protein
MRLGRRIATCPTVPNPASCSGGLRHCHVSHDFGCCLPAREGSNAAMYPMALDPASLLGRAPVLPHVLRLQILHPYSRGLRRCHMSHGCRSCLPAREGSGTATCPAAPDPVSLLGRAPTLLRVLRHQTPPPCSGGLQRCHVPHGSLWAANLKNKERLSWPTYTARLTCFQGMPAHYRDA